MRVFPVPPFFRMRMSVARLSAVAVLLSQSLPILSAVASTFTDVPPGYLYGDHIKELATRGIVKGNPDGTFKPGKTVNRAELLTMLYRAAGRTATAPTASCFKDVGATAWFSAVVCDAAAQKYVAGYSDGYFRPEKDVNRVEALKMIHTVLGYSLNGTASTQPLLAFRDVSLSAWYVPYLANAYERRILPIPGQQGTMFTPDAALTRGEAAAYIFNALGLTVGTSSASSSATVSSAQTRSSRSTSTESVSSSGRQVIDVDYPFGDDGVFDGKKGKGYVFSLQKPVVTDITVTVDTKGSVECRIYKLDAETSFALEYYLGHMISNKCSLRVALGNGKYQMEITPKGESNMHFDLKTRTVTGDGNDGFREASLLAKGKAFTSFLDSDDHSDWYTYKVTKQEKLTVELSSADDVRCLIYPMGDVDLYGFSGPVCNEEYDMPPGTYYVGVMRKDHHEGKETYTVRVK